MPQRTPACLMQPSPCCRHLAVRCASATPFGVARHPVLHPHARWHPPCSGSRDRSTPVPAPYQLHWAPAHRSSTGPAGSDGGTRCSAVGSELHSLFMLVMHTRVHAYVEQAGDDGVTLQYVVACGIQCGERRASVSARLGHTHSTHKRTQWWRHELVRGLELQHLQLTRQVAV